MPATVELSHGAFQIIAASAIAVPHTGDTAEFVFATIPIPAGCMGPNGILRISTVFSVAVSNGNNKPCRTRLGGAGGTQHMNWLQTTSICLRDVRWIQNRGAQNSQVSGYLSGSSISSTSASAPITSAIDMSVAQDLVISGQLGTNTDTITLESYIVEAFYQA